jgi:polysaccharide export outer membrane protein
MIPRPPYAIQPLDVLIVRVRAARLEPGAKDAPDETAGPAPIDGAYTVAPDGTISLGYSYGLVRVGGLTLQQAEIAIRRQVGRVLRNPQVAVGLASFGGVQQVRGEHLVRPDGTISLGTYGCVYVTGLTLAEVKRVIELHLSRSVLDPEVSVDVFAYNSKAFYIITDGAGFGQQVYRFPVTGNETVLDAISLIRGLPPQASRKYIWLARPTPAYAGCVQVFPVDWDAVVQAGSTATNYQIFPGDRIYVRADPFICLDNTIAKIVAPIERLLGVTLLGVGTVQSIRNINNTNNTTPAFITPIR